MRDPRGLASARSITGDLEQATIESFNQHPDAWIITSFPGLGPLTGARMLAETGDDRSRFADAKGLNAYAGAAPITRASGKTRAVLHRRVKDQRLAAAGYLRAFSALTASPGARNHYDRRKDNGDRHAAAQRNLFGRLLGCLHHCLATGQHYDEATAFPAATANFARQLDNLTASDVYNGRPAAGRDAFRLETLPAYAMDEEEAEYARWRATGELPVAEDDPWLVRLRRFRATGRTIGRVHVITRPLSQYLRYQFAFYPHSVAAGEDVRILDATACPGHGLPEQDFWLFDETAVVRMDYDRHGRQLGRELLEDADPAPYIERKRRALGLAVPFAQFAATLGE